MDPCIYWIYCPANQKYGSFAGFPGYEAVYEPCGKAKDVMLPPVFIL
jgi:hypothetical protein